MSPLFVALPGNEPLAERLAALCSGAVGRLETRDFPDGESYLRFLDDLTDRCLVLVGTLARPNAKILPLIFAAAAARDLGARKVGLVAPYLCYMRQDRRFQPGEAVTSRNFADLLSEQFDWLATVDPHLHRYKSLDEIYSIPARALHAGPAIVAWIKANIERPFLIGPDAESEQWVGAVARDCGAGFAVLHKERLGDRHVHTVLGDLAFPETATPILLDDILSSGQTMLEALHLIMPLARTRPVVIAVHGLFAEGAAETLHATGARLVTTNTVPNPSGMIDIAATVAPAIRDLAGLDIPSQTISANVREQDLPPA